VSTRSSTSLPEVARRPASLCERGLVPYSSSPADLGERYLSLPTPCSPYAQAPFKDGNQGPIAVSFRCEDLGG
jgi:hypothetical protein